MLLLGRAPQARPWSGYCCALRQLEAWHLHPLPVWVSGTCTLSQRVEAGVTATKARVEHGGVAPGWAAGVSTEVSQHPWAQGRVGAGD